MCFFRKRMVAVAMAAVVVGAFCACGGTGTEGEGGNAGQNVGAGGDKHAGNGQDARSGGNGGENSDMGKGDVDGGLRFLYDPSGDSACSTEEGYYYLTGSAEELRDGSCGMHLMYMDFATRREIYLCSTAGCRHDTPDCPAVFSGEEFPVASTRLFVFQDHLYILSREYDDDGTMSREMATFGDAGEVESRPVTLYRAKLDGTDRKMICSFDSDLTFEDLVLGDGRGIYVITKKLSVEENENMAYTTSSERKLMFLDLATLDFKEICSMDFGDDITWNVIGCHQDSLILSGQDFGHKLSKEETWDDDVYRELYENSSTAYVALGLDDGKRRELYRAVNKYSHSARVLGGSLYVSSAENQDVEEISIESGERKLLCSLAQNQILDVVGDVLCCRDWNLSADFTYYFVDTKTKEIHHGTLVNQCNGWDLEFRATTRSDVLVIYDYDATGHADGSYEIRQYKYALISKEDLFEGVENYQKIVMVGPGH